MTVIAKQIMGLGIVSDMGDEIATDCNNDGVRLWINRNCHYLTSEEANALAEALKAEAAKEIRQ